MKEDIKGRKGWVIERLGDIVVSQKGKKPKRVSKESNKEFQIPYVNIKAFEKNEIDEYTDGSGCVLCNEDDFLMVWDGSRSGYVGKAVAGALGSTLVKIDFPGISKDYAYYFLQSKFLQINTRAKGVGIPHVDPTLLWNYQFPLSPLPEQHAIVSKIEQLFSELDKGGESLKTAQQQLKVYRQSVLKSAFEGKLTEQWRQNQDLPDAQDLLEKIQKAGEEKAKASSNKLKMVAPLTKVELAALPELPRGWGWVRLDNLGELGRGKSKHRPRNDKKLFGGPYPFIQTGEVKAAGHTIKAFENTYSEFGLSQSKLWAKGTLCITIAANIAETAFLGFDGCFPDSIVGFTANSKIVIPEFIFYFFKGNQNKLESYAPATAQKNINLHTLENLIIPYCSLPEQHQIVQEIESRLSECDNMEATITTSLQQAEALRQSILKKAFEGRLLNDKELKAVRQDPTWESAERLLERIRAEKVGLHSEKKGRKSKSGVK